MKNSSRLLSIIDPIIRTWGSLSIGTGGHVEKRTRGSLCVGISTLDPYEQRFVIYPEYEKGVPKIALIKTVSETIDINEEVVNSWSIKAKEVEKIFENNENQHPWTNNMVYDSHTRTIPLNSDLKNLFMDDN